MKVLFSAFSCGPSRGSEPGIGWNWLVQVSRAHEIWLITTDEFQSEILRELPPGVHPTFLPSFESWLRLSRMRIPGLGWIYYYWWQWKVYCVARKLHREIQFDLLHHVTFGSWRAPTFLFLLPAPLIWGPLGGGETIPAQLRYELGINGRLFEAIRDLASLLSKWDPAVRLTMKKARFILVANRDTLRVIPPPHRHKTGLLMGIGMSGAEKAEGINHEDVPRGFIILFAGVLEPRKGGTLALKALQLLTQSVPQAHLVIIGQGNEQPRLVALADKLGITKHVRFLGGLPRSKVLSWMQAADVFFLPSLRDSAGFVFLEAMTAGKPVVCLDLGGPGEIITEECGIKVRPGAPLQTVEELAGALKKLATNPELRQNKGNAGRQRVQAQFDWAVKGRQMLTYYEEATCATRSPAQLSTKT